MTRVDELLQAGVATVRVLHGEGEHAVVAPVTPPGKLSHGHDLDRTHTELSEVVELGDDGLKGSLGAEGADV